MANYIKVSTQRLEQDRDSIQGELEGVRRAVERLGEEMQMLGQTWEGPAWQAFQNQAASDIENMQSVCSKINGFLRHMEYAGKEYRACESQVQDLVNSIWI